MAPTTKHHFTRTLPHSRHFTPFAVRQEPVNAVVMANPPFEIGLAQPPVLPVAPTTLAEGTTTFIVAVTLFSVAAAFAVVTFARFVWNHWDWARWIASKIRPRVIGMLRVKARVNKETSQVVRESGKIPSFDDKTWGTPTPSTTATEIPALPAILERWESISLDDEKHSIVLTTPSVSVALANHTRQAQLSTIREESEGDIAARYMASHSSAAINPGGGLNFTSSRWRSSEDEDILTQMTLRAAVSSQGRREGRIRGRPRQGSDASAETASTQPDLESFSGHASTASSTTSLSHAQGDEPLSSDDDEDLELEMAEVVQVRRVETKSTEVKRFVWRASKEPTPKVLEEASPSTPPTVIVSRPFSEIDMVDRDITEGSDSGLAYLASNNLLHPSSAPSMRSINTMSSSSSIDLADFAVPHGLDEVDEYYSSILEQEEMTPSMTAASGLDPEMLLQVDVDVKNAKRFSIPPFLVLKKDGGKLCRREDVAV